MSYHTVVCPRCHKRYMSEHDGGLCLACQRRVANGKRLAAIRKEQIQEERDAQRADLEWVAALNRRIAARVANDIEGKAQL
jgi:hypothetical protein